MCDLNQDGLVDDTDFGIFFPLYDDVLGVTAGDLSNRSTTAADKVDNRIGYAGYSWSPTTATYNVRHRVYDPMIGNWKQRDPLHYRDSSSLQEYVQSVVINAVDPQGLGGVYVPPPPNPYAPFPDNLVQHEPDPAPGEPSCGAWYQCSNKTHRTFYDRPTNIGACNSPCYVNVLTSYTECRDCQPPCWYNPGKWF